MAIQSDQSKKNKHLTIEDRKEIEDCLNKQMTFKAIGKLIDKDPTTISYEVKHHLQEHRNAYVNTNALCQLLLRPPYVCNGCKKRHSSSCHFPRMLYRAVKAQDEYRSLLTDAREGTPLNKEAFYEADRIITEGLSKGQHLYQIMSANPSGITCSKSTVYRHFSKGYYSASVIDLPRKVKFRPRKKRKDDVIPSGIRKNRTYDDFLLFCEENEITHHVELDTVIGRVGGKVIMTVHFTSCNFMVGLLMDNKSAAEGAAKFSALKDTLRNAGFSIPALFPACLTDNGGEFADVFSFENDRHDIKETSLFFCDPARSSQKPQIEKNHTLFRDIVPSGSSFDDFSQETVDLIFSHVNSVSRKLYQGKSAFEMFSFYHGDRLPQTLNISFIPKEHVIQSPILLKGIADLDLNK